MKALISLEVIEQRILLIRGQKVMLSTHLAELYNVETRVLNQAVKRNVSRFPEDFMFQLNRAEAEQLVSQNVIPHKKYFGGSLPWCKCDIIGYSLNRIRIVSEAKPGHSTQEGMTMRS